MNALDYALSALGVVLSSKPAVTLIEKISEAMGGTLRPWQIRRIAAAEADASIIKAEADIKITALQERALNRQIGETIRDQQAIESITVKTLPNLNEDAKPEDIERDWLTNFFDKGRLISDDEMQNLWAQILAGEANKPGTFSRRTVNFLSTLSRKEAQDFQKLCTLLCTAQRDDTDLNLIIDVHRLESLPVALSYSELAHLDNIGLIAVSAGFMQGYSFDSKRLELNYRGQVLIVEVREGDDRDGIGSGNIVLTQLGNELASICNVEIDSECLRSVIDYTTQYFVGNDYQVRTELPVPKPDQLKSKFSA
ncbi:DUF2806 domain-containing protein [Hymenobacter pini]|uniref:DUF2806 domain-containing protein n=1 Tax=Hymenobacter pini TaxID=2880879 RepID=UPI001CF28DB6|nr:DUF2806 domain-containing protein [Hymenobacter pini]MCA8830568.1 DUF2806 domain-containing protein [Hymenobacter pini]